MRGLVDGRNPPVNALRVCSERLRKYSSYALACLIHLWWQAVGMESKWILMKHLVYPRLSVSYSDLLRPSDWKCTFQLQSHGKIWVRDYSLPNTRDLTDFIITIIKPSNINIYILISFSRQFLISRNPHTLVLFMSVKKSREAKINKSTDFLIGFL